MPQLDARLIGVIEVNPTFTHEEVHLRQSLKQSLPAKIVALGFIVLTLLGNVWLIYALFGIPANDWLIGGTFGSIIVVFLGGIGLAWLALTTHDDPESVDENEDEGS